MNAKKHADNRHYESVLLSVYMGIRCMFYYKETEKRKQEEA